MSIEDVINSKLVIINIREWPELRSYIAENLNGSTIVVKPELYRNTHKLYKGKECYVIID